MSTWQTSPARHVFVLVCALSAGPAWAQGGPGPQPHSPRRLFDAVIGVIGDRVILKSTIDAELRSRYPDQQLTAAEHRRREQEILIEIARKEIWVQYGKVLGQQAPEAFEEIVERQIDKMIDAQETLYGSFTKMTAELEAIGTSIPEMRAQYRKDILSDIAQTQAVRSRLHRQFPLLVTPREMKRYFDEHPDEFGARSETDVARVGFSPKPSEPEQALLARVRRAAAAWREEPLSAIALAKTFDGVAAPNAESIQQDDDDPRARFLKEFAAAHREGEVSEPLRRGSIYYLLKVVRKLDQEERSFDDRAVQVEIHARLTNEKFLELNRRILMLNSQKLLVWPPWLLPRF